MGKKISVDNIKLAEIREYDTSHNGVSLDFYSYLFLVERNGFYFNPLDVTDEYPVYGRLPYSNTTLNGEDYGSKIKLLQGEVKDGPCIVICSRSIKDLTSAKEFSIEQLENISLMSNHYFKDRERIVNERFKYNPFIKNKFIKRDKENKANLEKLLNGEEKQLRK